MLASTLSVNCFCICLICSSYWLAFIWSPASLIVLACDSSVFSSWKVWSDCISILLAHSIAVALFIGLPPVHKKARFCFILSRFVCASLILWLACISADVVCDWSIPVLIAFCLAWYSCCALFSAYTFTWSSIACLSSTFCTAWLIRFVWSATSIAVNWSLVFPDHR